MLEVGKSGTAGTEKGVMPVLHDGALVATVRASTWKEAATAVVGGREWIFAKRKRELIGRWAADPEETARLHARQTSSWHGTWAFDLEGAALEARPASRWKGTHRFLADGRAVAETGSEGFWSPRPTLTVHVTLPLEHQVFLLWWELVMFRRQATATAAAAGSGGAVAAG